MWWFKIANNEIESFFCIHIHILMQHMENRIISFIILRNETMERFFLSILRFQNQKEIKSKHCSFCEHWALLELCKVTVIFFMILNISFLT